MVVVWEIKSEVLFRMVSKEVDDWEVKRGEMVKVVNVNGGIFVEGVVMV